MMALRIQTRKIEPDIVVVEFAGRFTLASEESQRIESRLNKLLSEYKEKLIFDLTGVERIDSTGVGILIYCFPTVKRAGGRLRLVDARGAVNKQFEATRLNRIFRVYPTVEAACAGFSAKPASR
jgi:anti-sigma B factor antagonist